MPAEERSRGDQEAGPSLARDRPTCRGEEDPIDCSELWRAGLAPEDPKLMAKDEDLEIVGTVVVTRINKETGKRPNDQAEEDSIGAF